MDAALVTERGKEKGEINIQLNLSSIINDRTFDDYLQKEENDYKMIEDISSRLADGSFIPNPIQPKKPKPFKVVSNHPNKLKIFAFTWNMGGNSPVSDLTPLFPDFENYQIIIVATQECLRSLSSSMVYSSKKTWENNLEALFGTSYLLIAKETLVGLHIAVFVHISLSSQVSQPFIQAVSTGFGGLVSNKGAIGVKFFLGNTSVLLVACHLASGQKAWNERNQSFAKIEKTLMKDWSEAPASSLVDVCIYLGDMNYRINGKKEDVELLVSSQDLRSLQIGDQLTYFLRFSPVFKGFEEGNLAFDPTYKFDKGTKVYDTSSKKRVPSWTDRILFKSACNRLKLKEYLSGSSSFVSDHRPVFAVFSLEYRANNNSITPKSQSKACTVI